MSQATRVPASVLEEHLTRHDHARHRKASSKHSKEYDPSYMLAYFVL